MSLEIQESISSFVDSELGIIDRDELDELIVHLNENEEQKKIWGRYCVISDAMKRSLPEIINHNLLQRIQVALESEPTLLAPAPSHTENVLTEAEIIELPKKTANISAHKPIFGFAIAASVTLVAVLGFQLFTQTNDVPGQAVIATSNEPATQQIQIAAKPVEASASTSVSFIVDELPSSNAENATYAEQSLIDDGQWTRITQVDGIPLENHFLSGRAESHVQFKLQGENFPFARSVNLEKTTTE